MKSEKELLEEIYEGKLAALLIERVNQRYFAQKLIENPKNENLTKLRNTTDLTVLGLEKMLKIIEEDLVKYTKVKSCKEAEDGK